MIRDLDWPQIDGGYEQTHIIILAHCLIDTPTSRRALGKGWMASKGLLLNSRFIIAYLLKQSVLQQQAI